MTQKSSTIQDDGRRRDGTEEKIINHQQESGCRQHDRWHLEGTPALPCSTDTWGAGGLGRHGQEGELTPRRQPASTGPMSFPAEEPLQGSRAPPEAGCHAQQPLPILSLRPVMYFHALSLSRLSSELWKLIFLMEKLKHFLIFLRCILVQRIKLESDRVRSKK